MKKTLDINNWLKLLELGWSVRRIANAYGISRWKVGYQLKKVGYKHKDYYDAPLLDICDIIWIAAVIDCEGTLFIHRPYNKSRKTYNSLFGCRVHMVNYDVPKRLHDLCGGILKERIRQSGNRKPQYYWNITSGKLRWLLPQIIPYMMVKKRHAEIIQEVLEKRGRGRKLMSDERLYELIDEIYSLNRKGKQKEV